MPVLYLALCQLPIPAVCGLINRSEVKGGEKCKSILVVHLKLAHNLFGGLMNNLILANLLSEMSVRNSGTESKAGVGDRPENHTPEI